MDIADKVVWITGASSGIGEALAYQIVLGGGKVVISARNEVKLKEMAEKIGTNCLVVPLDMSNPSSFNTAVENVIETLGRVDVLINNAGVSQRSLVAETGIDVIERIIAINYIGPAALTGLVLPHMIERKSGYCLFVSSVAGKFATPLRSTYAASKMALQGFADSLRAEVYSHGIKVSLIVPGFVKTAISLNALEGKGNKHDKMDPNQARGITPEEAARVIIRGMVKEKREIHMGMVPKTLMALFLSRYFPSLLAKMMRTAKVT